MAENGNGSAEIKTPLFSASMRGKDVQVRDVVVIGILLVSSVTAYAVWDHQLSTSNENKQMKADFTTAVKEMVQVNKEIAQNQRVMNCLISIDPKDRVVQLPTCERIAR